MDIEVGPDPAGRAASRIAERLRQAHSERGTANLALSGGGTAPPMISALLDRDVPWSTTTVWQVDERVAPDGADARNALQLEPLPCRVFLMPVTAPDLAAAARQYDASLPERLDVVHLGVGGDGHTASWPPGDDVPIRSERSVELIDEFHGVPRMTLTRRVVDDALARVVLTVGSGKRSVIERWLLGDPSLPITSVRSSSTWVFLDDQAAPPGFRPNQ